MDIVQKLYHEVNLLRQYKQAWEDVIETLEQYAPQGNHVILDYGNCGNESVVNFIHILGKSYQENIKPDYTDVAEALRKLGWNSPCDAQWSNLRDNLPQLAELINKATK